MKALWLVFLGGGAGAALRWYFSILINLESIKWVPTLAVNIIGCFLLGLAYGYTERDFLSSSWYLIIATGFCGGLTTFSTFSLEILQLLKMQRYTEAGCYLFISMISGIVVTYAGLQVANSGMLFR
jgi:CrcB protein